jgi:hypothetical protein
MHVRYMYLSNGVKSIGLGKGRLTRVRLSWAIQILPWGSSGLLEIPFRRFRQPKSIQARLRRRWRNIPRINP